jgi:hypothetical protein
MDAKEEIKMVEGFMATLRELNDYLGSDESGEGNPHSSDIMWLLDTLSRKGEEALKRV